jgi:hypothetical protein
MVRGCMAASPHSRRLVFVPVFIITEFRLFSLFPIRTVICPPVVFAKVRGSANDPFNFTHEFFGP